MLEMMTLSEEAAGPYIEDLARLRIQVFREYPYLYEGDMAYEIEYLDTFLKAQAACMVVAIVGGQVIGASTALPLMEETDNIKQPFLEAGYDISRIYYFGESVLLPRYRGQGIGKSFFQLRENFARQQPIELDWLTFCAVVRPNGHPMQPKDYQALDGFWKNRGFSPTELYCNISWQEVGESAPSPKPMRFWMKRVTN